MTSTDRFLRALGRGLDVPPGHTTLTVLDRQTGRGLSEPVLDVRLEYGGDAVVDAYHRGLEARLVAILDGPRPCDCCHGGAFVCPECGRTSHNANDKREGYCGACHWWTGNAELAGQRPARELAAVAR